MSRLLKHFAIWILYFSSLTLTAFYVVHPETLQASDYFVGTSVSPSQN